MDGTCDFSASDKIAEQDSLDKYTVHMLQLRCADCTHIIAYLVTEHCPYIRQDVN